MLLLLTVFCIVRLLLLRLTVLVTVLDDLMSLVNFVNTPPVKICIFASLCEEIGPTLFLYMEVCWLLFGKVMTRVSELWEKLKLFLKKKVCKADASNEWCAKLEYLADIFYHLNKLNRIMQRPKWKPAYKHIKIIVSIQWCISGNSMWKVPKLTCSPSPRHGKMSTLVTCVRS